MEHILKMLRITNSPTVAVSEDEILPESDEPPDDKVPEMANNFKKENLAERRASAPGMLRRESLLTRGLQGNSELCPASPLSPQIPRGLSTTSYHSFASTAELTSDAESILRSASPSPPPITNQLRLPSISQPAKVSKIIIAPLTKSEPPMVAEDGEAALETALGRKRCIMFACRDTPSEPVPEKEVKASEKSPGDAPPRKCRISFACPTKPSPERKHAQARHTPRHSSPKATRRQATSASPTLSMAQAATPKAQPIELKTDASVSTSSKSPSHPFHEFGSSHDDTEEWVNKADDLTKPKLLIDDLLKKEHAIRKIGKEAEEEAEEEEREQDEINDDYDEDDAGEDDFAPSDDEDETQTDDGNESDNEAGFAESDSESEEESEYQFWAPSNTSTRATNTDNITHFSLRGTVRSRASSTSSNQSTAPPAPVHSSPITHKATKAIKMRPGTPELPDSTDFVCGTLDEDRPLEAAYVSCREQKRREKLIPIPQDIDPSFPTTDPEDEDEVDESSDNIWMKDQFDGFNRENRQHAALPRRVSPLLPTTPLIAPPRQARPVLPTRATKHSPPPKARAKSPAPRRLFDHGAKRLRSPPPTGKLRSPRGSPVNDKEIPFGITINHLAQRPLMDKTSSLPHTPNPFFRNWRKGNQPFSRISSRVTTPGVEDPHPELHVRGPVDIVIGLEKKRQKRKEKYWRQNCRKAAKEHSKRPPPGRGVERMKELGLECAERTRGYGLGQQAQHVLSL